MAGGAPPAYPPNPGSDRPGFNASPEEGPVSPLHIGLILMILLAGLALGIGRSWWIDEKLDTAATKNPPVAASATPMAADAPPSIQSSIDRAYIPPLLDPDSDSNLGDRLAKLSPPSGKADVPPSAENPPKLPLEPAAPPPEPQAIQPKESSKVNGRADGPDSSTSGPESPVAKSEKKQKSGRQASTPKLATATRKERLKEIDRVRSQAFSETPKDRVGERKSAAPDTPIGPQSERRNAFRTKKVAQATVTTAQYARCERIGHIIRREQCKWELCNNKWGQGACPAFRHERPFLF